MPVYFTTLGSRNQRWYSTLDIIEPTPVVENNVVLYNALFTIPNPNGVLLPQMTTQVFFVVDSAENVLSVPASAVRPRGRGQWQVQVMRTGVAVDVPVEIGISDRVHTEIKSGLSVGDEVVIPTQAGMPPGAAAAMRMMRG
jgi:macrolide-specific efflux system membrane fusion protein